MTGDSGNLSVGSTWLIHVRFHRQFSSSRRVGLGATDSFHGLHLPGRDEGFSPWAVTEHHYESFKGVGSKVSPPAAFWPHRHHHPIGGEQMPRRRIRSV